VKDVVYQSLSPTEFEEKWKKVMTAIGFQNDSWFIQIYKLRDK
jgi:hypothetical protein